MEARRIVANQTIPPYFISIIDTGTNTVSGTINSHVPYPYGGLAFSPDGTKLYFTGIASNGQPVVLIIDTATNKITDTIVLRKSAKYGPGLPAITPNGEFLYVPLFDGTSNSANDTIVMVRTATKS